MIYKLLPPNDERVLSGIAPFDIETFKKNEKDLSITDFCNNMFETMKNYGGIGQKWVCINPEITAMSKETIRYKEGCLTFPFLFLDIERPQKIKVKYQNEQLETVEEEFDGIVSRCYQHELDHMHGRVFTELVSKLKLNMALKKRDKEIKRVKRLYEKKDT